MSQLPSSLLTAWQMVVRRGLSHWRILASVVIGVLLASAIMASTVIYFDALKELSLRNTLAARTPNELDLLATAEQRDTSLREFERVSAANQRLTDERVGWLVQDRVGAGKTATFFLTAPGDEKRAGSDDRRAYFAFAPRLEEFATVLPGGRMPRPVPARAPGEPLELEAVIPQEEAKLLDISLGDVVSTVPPREALLPHATVRIVGIFQRIDPADGFWYLYQRVLQSGTVNTVITAPLFIPPDTYLSVLGPAFGNLESTYGWLLDVDTDRLSVENASRAADDITAAQDAVDSEIGGYRLSTSLFSVFDEYNERLFFTRAPMLVFLSLVALVVLYHVVTLSSLLLEQQRGEISLLRSRGASSSQVLVVSVLEGLTIAALAAVVGPPLAAAALGTLGLTPVLSDLTGGAPLPVTISPWAYIMSGLGAVLSFAALMIPAVATSRAGVSGQRQLASRPATQPFYHRYYLDVMLLIAGILLFRQLSRQGSVVATGLVGEAAVNQLIAAVPAVVLVAVAMILLRLFPLALRIASRVSSAWLPVGLLLGLWQMARDPTHYARLSLLLILTAGLGVFAASFVGTLERSFEERVLYAIGSDIRVAGVELDASRFRPKVADSYREINLVGEASPAYRGQGFDRERLQNDPFTLLAVDLDSFKNVAWFREDFSSPPLTEALEDIRPEVLPEGIELPPRAASIAVLLRPGRADPNIQVFARVKDANDRYINYRLGWLGSADFLGNVNKPDWILLGSSLKARPPSSDPLTLVSLGINTTPDHGRLVGGSVFIDQITATTVRRASTTLGVEVRSVIVEPFDDASGWSVLRLSPDSVVDELRDADGQLDDSSSSVVFTWSDGETLTSRGIFPGPGMAPLPALASNSFLTDMGYLLGEELDVTLGTRNVRIRLVDTIDYFPTLDPTIESFVIVDLPSLNRFANLDPIGQELLPNEVWLSSESDGTERRDLLDRLDHEPFESSFVHDTVSRFADSQVDPLAKAGWSALLIIAFAAVFITSGIGFLVHAYVSVRSREVQFALMRTIGLSLRQLVALVWLEQVLVIVAGMVLGTWMGGRLGTIVMPFLSSDDRGRQVVPPFVTRIDWVNLGITYAAMALVFGLIIAGVIWVIRRISLRRMLRLGEM